MINALHTIQKTGLNIEGAKVTFKQDIGMAMAGGAPALQVTRAAFAIMIKFGDLLDDLQNMQDSVAMADDTPAIKEAVALSLNADQILNCWKSAS